MEETTRGMWSCPACGSPNTPGSDSCRTCGRHLHMEESTGAAPRRSKTSAKDVEADQEAAAYATGWRALGWAVVGLLAPFAGSAAAIWVGSMFGGLAGVAFFAVSQAGVVVFSFKRRSQVLAVGWGVGMLLELLILVAFVLWAVLGFGNR